MMKLTCPKCRFSMKLQDHQANGREFCPQCHGGLMEFSERDQLKLSGGWKRKKRASMGTAPGVIRNLIFGILLLLSGPGLLLWATTWPERAGAVKAVFVGHGIVLTGWGIVLLVMAALGKKD